MTNPTVKLYHTLRWQNVTRPAVLQRDEVCTRCDQRPSEVAEHVKAHDGNADLFFDMDNLRGVCKPCFDASLR
jgi:5-methylcytosine-specific restriction enzyme A